MWTTLLNIALARWRTIALVGYSIALVWIGYGCASSSDRGEVQTVTDTVHVDRTLIKRDTVTQVKPETVIRYRRDTVHTVDTVVTAPVGLTDFNLLPPTPVKIDGREVTVTSYDPADKRWQQAVYRVERPDWSYGLSISAYRSIAAHYLGELEASLRYKRLSVKGRAGYHTLHGPRVLFGLSYTLLGR